MCAKISFLHIYKDFMQISTMFMQDMYAQYRTRPARTCEQ